MKFLLPIVIALLLLTSSSDLFAAPAATITASPSSCSLSEAGDFCEVTLSYTATDVPIGSVVEVLDAGFDFLVPINSPGATVNGNLDVLVGLSGKTFGVVLNQGVAADEVLATVVVNIETETLPGDADGDGVKDEDDAFPNDPDEFRDANGNGIGDNADNAAAGGGSGGSSGGGSSSGGSSNSVTGDASVTSGQVELTRAGESSGSNVIQISAVRAGDIVRTGVGGAIDLNLQDNSLNAATIAVGESSELIVEEVTDPALDTVWSVLNSGEVNVIFNRQTSDLTQGVRRCPVRTPNVGVCARGTGYKIEYSLNGDIGTTTITVREGVVELIDATGNLVALVDAGESHIYTAAAVSEFPDISGSYAGVAYLMTTSNSANVTELHILNISDTTQSFTGTLFNASGEQLGEAGTSLAVAASVVNSRLVFTSQDLEDLFGVEPWRGPAMLEIEGIAPFEVMTKLTNPSGLVSNTNCVREQNALNIEGHDSDVTTFVRFINTSDSPITDIRGSLYDEQGELIGSGDIQLLASLGPKQQVWLNRDQLSELVGVQWSGVAALQIGEKAGLKLLNLNFVNGDTFFNFSCFEVSESASVAGSETGFVFLQTTSLSPYQSLTHFVNTSKESQAFTATLYSVAGLMLGSSNQSLHAGVIAPNGRLVLSSSDLEGVFGVSAWSGPALLEVTGTGDFDLMTRLTSASGLISNSNCTRDREVHNIEGFDSSVLSFVRLINTGETSLTGVSGELLDGDGEMIGGGTEVLVSSLPAKSAIWLNRNDLSDIFGDTWIGEASLIVSNTDNALRLLNLNFVNNETFTNFSCYDNSQ